MIEQSTLLRLARDYAERKKKERPSLKAIVLIGSVARGEPPLGDAVDLDVLLIDDLLPDPPYEFVRLSENVLVEALFVRAADYADRRALRAHHFSAPALNDALILYDPRHYFDILQASIRAPYNKPDNIYARARSAFTGAQQVIDRFALWREDPPPAPPANDELKEFRQALYLAAQSLILLSGQPGDTVGPRKFMARFEAVARQHHPELYSLYLAALGVADLPSAYLDSLLPEWLALYKSAGQRGVVDPLIHPAKRGYYERGFRALSAEGHGINTLWLFEHTLAAAAQGLDPHPAAWLNLMQATGKAALPDFLERIRYAEQLVALTEETLTAWAKKESVEW